LTAASVKGGLRLFPLRVSGVERDEIVAEGYGPHGASSGGTVLFEVASPSLVIWVVRTWVRSASKLSEDVWGYVLEPASVELERLLEPRSVSAEVTRARTARSILIPDPQSARSVMDSAVMEKFSRLSASRAIAFEVDREPVLVPMPSLFCASADSLLLGMELFWRELSILRDGDEIVAGVLLENEAHVAAGRFRKVLSPFGRFGLIDVESVETLSLK